MRVGSIIVWFLCFAVGMALSAKEMDVAAQTFLQAGIGFLLLANLWKD